MPRLGEKWVKFYRPLMGGERKLCTCLQSEYEKLKLPVDELLPGVYNSLGDVHGSRVDHTKSRAVAETQWHPFLLK